MDNPLSAPIDWEHINLLLTSHNFDPLSFAGAGPDLFSVSQTLLELLSRLADKKRECIEYSIKIKDLEKLQLSKELSHAHEQALRFDRERQSIQSVRSDPSSKDADHPAPAAYGKLDTAESDEAKLLASEPGDVLQGIMNLLVLQEPAEVLPAVHKLQTVVLTLPKYKAFLAAVCEEVLPHSPSPTPDEILRTVRTWRRAADKHSKLVQALGCDSKQAAARAKAMGSFCNWFEVGGAEVQQVVKEVFDFVVEMKKFLSVSSMQFARSLCGLDQKTPVKTVLKHLGHMLQAQHS